MPLSNPQQQIVNCDRRFVCVVAGRRFGKSYLGINEMVKFARHPNRRVLAVAPTYKQVKNVWWDDLKSMLIARNWVKKINESELQITLINGSKITLRSADNRDALRGGKYDFIVLDECGDMDPACWYSVLRPTLSDTGGHALFIGSPKGRDFFYDLYLHGQSNDNWQSWQFTTADGGNVTEEELAQARADLDERTFNQEYLAEFLNITNIIYYSFADENVTKRSHDLGDRAPLHIGMDFNVDPGCAVVGFQHRDGFHICDEIEIYGTNTNEMVDEIYRRKIS